MLLVTSVSRPVANDLFDSGRCYIREFMSLHTENFLLIEAVQLQDVKFGIWCDVSAAMTLGFSLFLCLFPHSLPPSPKSINLQQYVTHIYTLLCLNITNNLCIVCSVFLNNNKQVILHFPDIIVCGFYIWDTLRDKA